jgi:geranyl-CoA carboxylase alpha subunit
MEARLYAEDPDAGYLPQTGRIAYWQPPGGPGVRTDGGIATGLDVTPHYDPLLAKIIAHGATREEARTRLAAALEDTLLLGVTTNKTFLLRILAHPEFAAGKATTALLAGGLAPAPETGNGRAALAWALAAVLLHGPPPPHLTRWQTRPTWAELLVELRGIQRAATVIRHPDGTWETRLGEAIFTFTGWVTEPLAAGAVHVRFGHDGVQRVAHAAGEAREVFLDVAGLAERFTEALPAPKGRAATGRSRLLAPMSGRVVAVRSQVGDRVSRGQCLLVLESMKIQHEIAAGGAGQVVALPVNVGDQVSPRQLLAEVDLLG